MAKLHPLKKMVRRQHGNTLCHSAKQDCKIMHHTKPSTAERTHHSAFLNYLQPSTTWPFTLSSLVKALVQAFCTEKQVWVERGVCGGGGESQSASDWETPFWVTVCMVACLIFVLTNYQCFVRTMPLTGTICGTICEDSSPRQCENAVALKYTQIHPLGRHSSRTCLAGEQTGKTLQWPTSYRAATRPQMLALINRSTTARNCVFLSWSNSVHSESMSNPVLYNQRDLLLIFQMKCPLILIFFDYFYVIHKVLVSQPFFRTWACLKRKKAIGHGAVN